MAMHTSPVRAVTFPAGRLGPLNGRCLHIPASRTFGRPATVVTVNGNVLSSTVNESRLNTRSPMHDADTFFRDPSVNGPLKYTIALGIEALEIDHEIAREIAVLNIDAIRADDVMRERAADILTRRLVKAGGSRSDTALEDTQTLYLGLRQLLGLPYEIFSDSLDRAAFSALRVEERRSYDDLIARCAARRTPGQPIRTLDIGTGTGMMPLFLQGRLRAMAPHNPAICVGTELPDAWESNIPQRIHALADLGLAVEKGADTGSIGAQVLLTPLLPPGTYDIITWLRPFIGASSFRALNKETMHMLPSRMGEYSTVVSAVTFAELPLGFRFFKNVVNKLPTHEIERSRIRMARIRPDLEYFDPDATVADNLRAGRVLDASYARHYPYFFLLERGRRDATEEYDAFFTPRDTFAEAYRTVLNRSLKHARGRDASLMRRSLAVLDEG